MIRQDASGLIWTSPVSKPTSSKVSLNSRNFWLDNALMGEVYTVLNTKQNKEKDRKKRPKLLQTEKKKRYPDSAVTTGKHRAQENHRETARQKSLNEETNRIPFTLTYHRQNLAIKNVILKKSSKFPAAIPKLNKYFLYHHPFHSNATKTWVTF